ncbi:hypothetical protein Aduo_004721 [Ancylostoma duodenale]
MHHSIFDQDEPSTCALFVGSYRLRNVTVRFMDEFEGRRCVLLHSGEDGIVELLVIPFLHILRIINSHHLKDSESQSHGISVELDPTASKKLALVYAEALNDEQRKIIFYDLTSFDEPKMTITMLFTGGYPECSWYKRLHEWVRRGNLECITRDSLNGLVVLEELPFTRWCTYLVGLGIITRGNSKGFSSAYGIDENRREKSDICAMISTDSTVTRELPKTRKSRSNDLYKVRWQPVLLRVGFASNPGRDLTGDVFDSDGIERKNISANDKITENEVIQAAD